MTPKEAHKQLQVMKPYRRVNVILHSSGIQGTVSSQKNELLFSRFGINYNDIDALYRKGSILLWEVCALCLKDNTSDADDVILCLRLQTADSQDTKKKRSVVVVHEDLITEEWWTRHQARFFR
jgi:tRNA(His) guanylyltransferase